MSSGTRVQYVMMTRAGQQFSGLLLGRLFCFVAGAWSEQSCSDALARAIWRGLFWGRISAAYSGLHAASFAIREEDVRMNTIMGHASQMIAFVHHCKSM